MWLSSARIEVEEKQPTSVSPSYGARSPLTQRRLYLWTGFTGLRYGAFTQICSDSGLFGHLRYSCSELRSHVKNERNYLQARGNVENCSHTVNLWHMHPKCPTGMKRCEIKFKM